MIPLEEARGHVLARVEALPARRVPLEEALGLVLAEPVSSSEPIPAFANTAMDGYAVRAADTVGAPLELEVVGTIGAGDEGSLHVGAGQAARIMTGAPIPPGADAVVKVELTSRPAAPAIACAWRSPSSPATTFAIQARTSPPASGCSRPARW